MGQATVPNEDVAKQFQREWERSLLRYRNGLDQVLRPEEAPVGQTPHETTFRLDRLQVYHYPSPDQRFAPPLLIATSLVSRPYILDLHPGSSLIEYLVNRGFEVYLIDWGVPAEEDARLSLDDYVNGYLPKIIRHVKRVSGESEIHLAGYCMGGLFALWYAALHPRSAIRSLLCLATPVDFEHLGLFARWADRRYFDVDKLVDTFGNVPADLLQTAFNMLRPTANVTKYVNLWVNLWNDEYVASYRAFDRWVNDWIPFPGEAFREVTKSCIWDNQLIKGQQVIGGKQVDLGKIRCPILNVAAASDHIVPLDSTRTLTDYVGSEDRELYVAKAGHAGLVAGRSASRGLFPKVGDWLAARSDEIAPA
ncbi:MAG TPA: alpha/beta fold hydrolase [Dehalococcoidia bacterium]|nr:alpha/beta fold hydrolase [Dehalococcoidia bacterium]